MMSTITEGATRTKRRRTGNDSNNGRAAQGSSANAIIDLSASLLDKRLLPIKDVLALQPTQLKDTTITASTEMLDFLATIRQREKSHARFDKPQRHPVTGDVLVGEDNIPKPFIPSSLRAKCKVESSDLSNDDTRMRTVLEEAEKEYAIYQLKAATSAKLVSTLEITIRWEKFRTKFYEFVTTFASAYVCITKTRAGGFNQAMKLDMNDLATKMTYDLLENFSQTCAQYLGKENGTELRDEFAASQSFDNTAIVEKMDCTDGDFMLHITNQLKVMIPVLTTRFWSSNEKRDLEREVNAELKKLLKPKAMAKANNDVEDAMEVEDNSQPPQQIADVVRKETKRAVDKEVQKLKKQLRKNYSADGASQPLTPTKNGREQSDGSKNSRRKSKKKSGGGTKLKSALKKGSEVRYAPTPPKANDEKNSRKGRHQSRSNESPSSKGGAGRGGSRRGGRGRGAGRR